MVKRGQLFLIAALIISIIILSLGYVYNTTSSPKTDTTVYDISNHINFEGAKVIDYGVIKYTDSINSKITENLKTLVQGYYETNPQADYTVIYGTSSSISMMSFTSNPGYIGIASAAIDTNTEAKWYTITTTSSGATTKYTSGVKSGNEIKIIDTGTTQARIDVTLSDIRQQLEFSKGQTFYLIISKNTTDERIISSTIK